MIRQHRLDAYLRSENGAARGLRVAGEGDAGRVRRPTRGEGDAMELSQLALVFSIVVRGPDLFIAASVAYKRDLRGGDSRQAAGQFADDFIGELVSESPDLCIVYVTPVHFSNDRGQRGVANIVQPGLNFERILGGGQIAVGEKLSGRGIIGPTFEVNFPGN